MKTLAALFIVVLAGPVMTYAVPSYTYKLHCSNGTQTLDINYQVFRLTKLTAVLKSQDGSYEFSGVTQEYGYEQSAKVHNPEIGEAHLTVVKSLSYGGRCGRCDPNPSIDYNAKLTVGQTVANFQCWPQ